MSREKYSLAIFNFTDQGNKTALRLAKQLGRERSCTVYDCRSGRRSARKTVEEVFTDMDALIFVGAAGIAVRLIAPFVREKTSDPAVLVIDEKGKYVIPVLSGHIGGANALARETAGILGALPVITTATDLNGAFAADVFAAENGMAIEDMGMAKDVSAAVLRGEPIGFFSDFPVEGCVPPELTPGIRQRLNLYITQRDGAVPWIGDGKEGETCRILRLVPRTAVLGMGCRLGASDEAVSGAARAALAGAGLSRLSLSALATVDRKKEEPALRKLAQEWKLDFCVYTAGELGKVAGKFSESEFVKKTVGVGNVCERAAVLAAARRMTGGDTAAVQLAAGKTAAGSATAAVAVLAQGKEERIRWKKNSFT